MSFVLSTNWTILGIVLSKIYLGFCTYLLLFLPGEENFPQSQGLVEFLHLPSGLVPLDLEAL